MSFISFHLLNKLLLNTYYVLGTILGAVYIAENKIKSQLSCS